MLYLNEFTTNKKDVKLFFHAQKMFNSINNNKSFINFEKEKIEKDYQNNFFFKKLLILV
ncbi:hypothetical protein J8J04_00620 ['Fragaria x ananassa' phyllody phytoplasma]|uniref:Uncharacterized protein n=1 Tax='Fragaria x ananassa' phyllody phytoplasma TaxID=2358428 RepID=A0ABS5K381_9MOLU|nr:hypothetical protein ['Fragaria x ananassa' phyllody phytoplasma]MBS2126224.1 hypothetical protein ['Fragaria x ananassa' phyllody phytoplasma]